MKPIFSPFAGLLLMIVLSACSPTSPQSTAAAAAMAAPDAEKRPYIVRTPFGAEREDEYYWLRDDERKAPDMLAYLEAENAYADAVMAPLKPLEHALYDEYIARIKQDDSSVPWRKRGYWYYTRYEAGKDYPIYARRADADNVNAISIQEANANGNFTDEQILLDVNQLAEGRDYYQVGNWEVSPDNRLLAFAEDFNGRRQYTISVLDLASGERLPDSIVGMSASLVWADDNKTLLYVENDPETLLGKRVKLHVIGTSASQDSVVYEEPDDSFYLGIGRTRDDHYIVIHSSSTVSDEMRYAPANNPRSFRVLAERERDVEYDADHLHGRWVIRTNADNATNFKLVEAPGNAASRQQWTNLIAHDDAVFIEGVELFDGFMVVAERSNALERLRIVYGDGREEYVKADEPAYSMGLSSNPETDTPWLRYSYTSMTTPASTYEMNVATGERRLLKQQPVPGYDPAQYVTERLWAPARDGTQVPVTLVYRNGLQKNGTAALLLYGYGSYGMSMDPGFNQTTISLLDRGMVYAIAHIRGGQELGRQWYENGKLLKKINTFTDFIDVTRFLVSEGYAAKDRVAAYGGSAGGLLMGAISNMAADDYRVIISQVPFVDVVTTMLDPGIPLTTNEYDEWGNPEQQEFYGYMLSYSPYDQLQAKAYPAMYVGTGLWDSQVQYWEPAKYVARLRDLNTGTHPVIFRTNMEAGHGGKSGRFRRFRETAEAMAFMLDQLGVKP